MFSKLCQFFLKFWTLQGKIFPQFRLQWHSWKIQHILKLFEKYIVLLCKAELNSWLNYKQIFFNPHECPAQHFKVTQEMGAILHSMGCPTHYNTFLLSSSAPTSHHPHPPDATAERRTHPCALENAWRSSSGKFAPAKVFSVFLL